MDQIKRQNEPVRIMIGRRPLTPDMAKVMKDVARVLDNTRKSREAAAAHNYRIIGLKPHHQ